MEEKIVVIDIFEEKGCHSQGAWQEHPELQQRWTRRPALLANSLRCLRTVLQVLMGKKLSMFQCTPWASMATCTFAKQKLNWELEGWVHFPLLSTGEIPPEMPCPDLGYRRQTRQHGQHAGRSPVEGQEDRERLESTKWKERLSEQRLFSQEQRSLPLALFHCQNRTE